MSYIEREAVNNICLKHYNESFDDIPAHEALYAVTDDINKAPAADVVEVVRCKNCVFGEPFGEVLSCECYHSPFVSGGPVYVSDNDFCPYGIRREEDE